MIVCPFAYYDKLEDRNYEIIMCRKLKGACPYSRFCAKENKVIPNNTQGYTMNDCNLNKVNIPKGASEVVKTVSNNEFLYVNVETEDGVFTRKIKNTLNEIPNYVYLQLVNGEYQIVKKNRK